MTARKKERNRTGETGTFWKGGSMEESKGEKKKRGEK